MYTYVVFLCFVFGVWKILVDHLKCLAILKTLFWSFLLYLMGTPEFLLAVRNSVHLYKSLIIKFYLRDNNSIFIYHYSALGVIRAVVILWQITVVVCGASVYWTVVLLTFLPNQFHVLLPHTGSLKIATLRIFPHGNVQMFQIRVFFPPSSQLPNICHFTWKYLIIQRCLIWLCF